MEDGEVRDEKRLVCAGCFGAGGSACSYGSKRSATPRGIASTANDYSAGTAAATATAAHTASAGAAVGGTGRRRAGEAGSEAASPRRKILGDAPFRAHRRAGDQVHRDRGDI